jgi:two-component system phosphate regulon response regulator PhoB
LERNKFTAYPVLFHAVPPRTLIVQKDPALREAAAAALAQAGHAVVFAESVAQAEQVLRLHVPEAMLADLALPEGSMVSLIRAVRRDERTRGMTVVVLSARAGEDDKVLALEAGADDYVAAPFSSRELAARMESILRRRAEGALTIGALRLEPASYRVIAQGRDVALSPKEYRLLHVLMQSAGRVVTRAQLVDALKRDGSSLSERSIDAQINRLRRALAPHGCETAIETVPGIGYRVCGNR